MSDQYSSGNDDVLANKVGQCRLNLSNPCLKRLERIA